MLSDEGQQTLAYEELSQEHWGRDLFIKTLDGNTIKVPYSAGFTVEMIKLLVYEQNGMFIEDQRLIFAGKQLENNRTLADYCVQYESTFHLVAKLNPDKSRSKPSQPGQLPPKYEPQDSSLFTFDAKAHLNSSLATKLTSEPVEGLFTFPVLTEAYCAGLMTEIDAYLSFTGDSGIALPIAQIGLYPAINILVRDHISPVINTVYPQLRDTRYSILPKLMTYSKDDNSDWPVHMDGDLCTINILLSNQFEGGALRVYKPNDESAYHDLKHNVVGMAVIHPGDIKHAVLPLTAGRRTTLIIKVKTPTKPHPALPGMYSRLQARRSKEKELREQKETTSQANTNVSADTADDSSCVAQ